MSDAIACVDCRSFYAANRDALVGACASVGIEHGLSQGAALQLYLDGYHKAGHREKGPEFDD